MKNIEIRKALWQSSDKRGLLQNMNITTDVIIQGDIILDPRDKKFQDAIFKEFVRYARENKKEITINLELDLVDIFFYTENANVYMFNYIYQELFGSKDKKPFNPILEDKEEGEFINLKLFTGAPNQILYLTKILKALKIDLKKLSNEYQLPLFEDSLKTNISNLHYEKYENDELKQRR